MKSILLASALILTLAAGAQDSLKSHNKYQSGPFFSTIGFGIGWQDFSGLNERLEGLSQYEKLKDYTALLHLGWLKERNRLISNAQLSLGSSLSGDRNQKSSVVRFIGLAADVGYDLLGSERMMLFPLAGIGYEWYQAKFYRDLTNLDFDDVLNSPTVQNAVKAVGFKNDFFTYRLGIGFNILSPKSADYGIGIQAAYTGSFQERNWKTNDQLSLNNAPQDQLSRFQVSLILSARRSSMMNH